MTLRFGAARCLVVVAPHADDETIGAYGLMRRARAYGMAVRVVVVTDGSASHPGSLAWPRTRLVRERQRETRRAMRRIGITAGHVTFLGLPDGNLDRIASVVRRRVAKALRRARRPLIVAAPAVTDDHPDHRIVAAAVAGAGAVRGRRLAYPVWPAGTRWQGAHRLTLTGQERLAKRYAIRSYRTQAGRITDDPAGFAMTRAQIAAFSRPAETFVEGRR